MSWVLIGIWVWGGATIVLTAACLIFVVLAGFYLDADGKFSRATPTILPGMYISLKDNGSLVASILAVSAVGWSYFFNQYFSAGSH
jgi:hypothetical protein